MLDGTDATFDISVSIRTDTLKLLFATVVNRDKIGYLFKVLKIETSNRCQGRCLQTCQELIWTKVG